MAGVVRIRNQVWDISLCAVDRFGAATGQRWQHHGIWTDSLTVADGSRYPYAYSGAQQAYNDGTGSKLPQTPAQLYSKPGSPGLAVASWDMRCTWMWALQQVGYTTSWFGKVYNSWPGGAGDTYVMNVGGVPVLNRYFHMLDDNDWMDQSPTGNGTNNAYLTGQPYSGIDHTTHVEANYLARTGNPFNFNDQGTLLPNQIPANGDNWTPFSTYGGTAGYANRYIGGGTVAQSAYLTDFYNRKIGQFFRGTDGKGVVCKPPFALYLAVRGGHRQWVVAQRHWNAQVSGTSGAYLGVTDNALGSGATTLTWNNMPALTARSTANGTYVMIGQEAHQVNSVTGTVGGAGQWTLTRNVLNDVGQCLLQQNGVSPAWPAGSVVYQLSSSTAPDVGDNPSFNEQDFTDKSPWWRDTNPHMTPIQCVQARHDRITKGRTDMSVDELVHDIVTYCRANYANPTVAMTKSDNGWSYGEHGQPTGKMEPYKMPACGPMFCDWPDELMIGSGLQYPYFAQRPNIIFVMTDDDDYESLYSGYPILNGKITRTEENCLAHTADMAASICDLAGATPYRTMFGQSLIPYISGAKTGGSPRKWAPFAVKSDMENGAPDFRGIQSTTQRFWHWYSYPIAPNPLTTGSTACTAGAVPGKTYPAMDEGYDLTVDADEMNNFMPNATVNPGYTPPNQFSAADLAELKAALNASLISGGEPPIY